MLITTIRSDSYDTLQQQEALNEVQRNLLSLEPIARGEIARIIRMPGEVLQAKVGAQAPTFSAEVVEALQREMEDEPDALPLLADEMYLLRFGDQLRSTNLLVREVPTAVGDGGVAMVAFLAAKGCFSQARKELEHLRSNGQSRL